MNDPTSSGDAVERGPLLFGTDGIRDRVGEGYLTPESLLRLCGATASVLGAGRVADAPRPGARTVVVGRDTRASGAEILRLLADGYRSHGFAVRDVGVLPTPAVAFLVEQSEDAALGVVISASHNPADYNGVKFFSHGGVKATDDFEREVSTAYWRRSKAAVAPGPAAAMESAATEGFERYVEHLVSASRRPGRLRGRRVALDTAHGATSRVAPAVFERLGMDVRVIGDRPDGRNINDACGALHPEALARLVVSSGADIGFSFDGDGDRMVPVGRSGRVYDGDHVLYLAARWLRAEGRLPAGAVVATVMSNFGLEKALVEEGVRLLRTDVGDRHVYRAMVDGAHPVGGEQSGHTIFLEDATTGDGILSAIRLLDALEGDGLELDAEAGRLESYPQLLENVRVREKRPFEELASVVEAVENAERELTGRGRVLLRYSGTEPLARVMVEGDDSALIERLAGSIVAAIRDELVSP